MGWQSDRREHADDVGVGGGVIGAEAIIGLEISGVDRRAVLESYDLPV